MACSTRWPISPAPTPTNNSQYYKTSSATSATSSPNTPQTYATAPPTTTARHPPAAHPGSGPTIRNSRRFSIATSAGIGEADLDNAPFTERGAIADAVRSEVGPGNHGLRMTIPAFPRTDRPGRGVGGRGPRPQPARVRQSHHGRHVHRWLLRRTGQWWYL